MSRQPYVRPVSKTTWYMRNGRYRKYMLREVTCLLVGVYCFLTIWALAALAAGADTWNGFLASQQNTVMVVFHAFALVYFLIYQAFDWFKLAPKAMPVQLGEKKLPDRYIIIAHYVAWAFVSLFVFWLTGVI
ncbi:MAG: fumarate reductase subunit C [Xanthomonadales bacterium]|nr:fumarate reductase subunit C [Gammaproteobacteria bacterium]MBT8052466.1 fumarate reductase subunit C [Gammaproteobacteria bacterium]NND57160.1 fumarate reductase subunit C [Xanthomonadales bacterium]NNK52810.1 fumarate reductase subunit C [Xanthomonadales bacterium]